MTTKQEMMSELETKQRQVRAVRAVTLEESGWVRKEILRRYFWTKHYRDTTFTIVDPDSAIEIEKSIQFEEAVDTIL